MATLISSSINVTKIPKDKIIDGDKGKWVPLTFSVNDEVDQFGNNCSIFISQTKEERESKTPKVYLGNGKVVWTNGNNVDVPPRDGQTTQATKQIEVTVENDDDLPF